MGNALQELEGGGELARQLAGISQTTSSAYSRLANGSFSTQEGAQQLVNQASGGANQMMIALARADRNSEEYRAVAASLSAQEGGRELLAGGAQRAALERQLSGQGRRGRAGAVDALIGLTTGNTFSGMEFHLGEGRGRRDISASQARRILMAEGQGGRGAEIVEQMQTQLTQMGMSSEEARTQMMAFRNQVGDIGTRRMQQGDLDAAARLGDSAGLSAVRESAQRQSRESALARDPVGAEQLRVLQAILDRLPDAGTRRSEQNAAAQATGEAVSSSVDANMTRSDGAAVNASEAG
ncbi:MAG: hypothetical protein ACO32I_09565 [Candidatus Limnocylindrus sp.]